MPAPMLPGVQTHTGLRHPHMPPGPSLSAHRPSFSPHLLSFSEHSLLCSFRQFPNFFFLFHSFWKAQECPVRAGRLGVSTGSGQALPGCVALGRRWASLGPMPLTAPARWKVISILKRCRVCQRGDRLSETSSVWGHSLSITAFSVPQKMPKAQQTRLCAEPLGTYLKTPGS